MRIKLGDSIVSQDVDSVHLCGPLTVQVANGTVVDGDRNPANMLSVTGHTLVYHINIDSSF